MNVIFTVLIAFPLGYFVSQRGAAVLTYVLADGFLFTFQTAFLVMKWVDGDDHAFGDRGRDWSTEQYGQFYSYLVLNAVIIAVGMSDSSIMFLSRTSVGDSPTVRATTSIMRSRAHVSLAHGPR